MSEEYIEEQTAFETAGIPTPPEQQHIAATDKVSEWVEAVADNLATKPEKGKKAGKSKTT